MEFNGRSDMSEYAKWLQALNELAKHHETVKLRPLYLNGEPATDAPIRTRLLEVEADDAFLVECSHDMRDSGLFDRAQSVLVILEAGGSRWQGHCQVIGPVEHEPESGQPARALRLGHIEQIDSAQRRQFFRAGTVGSHAGPVEIHSAVPGSDKYPAAVGELANLSGGGMGVTLHVAGLDPRAAAVLKDRHYRCVLNLPGYDEPIEVRGELVRMERRPRGLAYLGIRFDFDKTARRAEVEESIVRFTTELQRTQLRRVRGSG